MKKKLRKAKDAIFGGALALQALPILKASGRTPQALASTAEGFIGIGIAGKTAGVAFDMVKAPFKMGLSKKKKNSKRR